MCSATKKDSKPRFSASRAIAPGLPDCSVRKTNTPIFIDKYPRLCRTETYQIRSRIWRREGADPRHQVDAELLRGVAAQHSSHRGLRDIRGGHLLNRVPCAGRILMRITRSPNDLLGEILGQLENQPLLRVKAEHDLALLPHLFGVGSHGIVVQQRNGAGRRFHLLEHFFHPRGLAVRYHHLHVWVALHHGESDQRRRDEHMIVEPRRNDLSDRMSERRRRGETERYIRSTTSGRSAPPRSRERTMVLPGLYLFEE